MTSCSKQSAFAEDVVSAWHMVFVTPSLWVVFKRTGGKAWNKKWGLPRLSRPQKENRVKQRKEEQGIRALLKEAAERDPLNFQGTIVGRRAPILNAKMPEQETKLHIGMPAVLSQYKQNP